MLFKKIYEEYHPKHVPDISQFFDHLVYKEYGIALDNTHICYFKIPEDISPSPLYSLIMNDEITMGV